MSLIWMEVCSLICLEIILPVPHQDKQRVESESSKIHSRLTTR